MDTQKINRHSSKTSSHDARGAPICCCATNFDCTEKVESDARKRRRAALLDGDHHLFPHNHNDDDISDASDTEPDNVSITMLGTPAHGRTIFF